MEHDLLNAIRTLPSGYQEFLNKTIPEIPDAPQDIDAAQIKCGQLANFLLNLFSQFVGLHLLKVPYLMGQGNEAVLGLLMASLELENPIAGTIVMIMPSSGGVYPGGINEIKCQAEGATAIYASTESDDLTLEQDTEHEDIWSVDYPLTEPGVYTIMVTGSFEGGESMPKPVTFEITE